MIQIKSPLEEYEYANLNFPERYSTYHKNLVDGNVHPSTLEQAVIDTLAELGINSRGL
jgi:hypothetical protein